MGARTQMVTVRFLAGNLTASEALVVRDVTLVGFCVVGLEKR